MKKLFAIAVIVLITAISSQAQKITMANYTDTLSGADTHYYAATVQGDLFYGSMGCYVDHLTGSTDSVYIKIQGSLDGSTWIDLGASTYSSCVTIGDAIPTTFKAFRAYTTDGGMVWAFTDRMTLPYYRWSVTHYATGTMRFKAWMYKKK